MLKMAGNQSPKIAYMHVTKPIIGHIPRTLLRGRRKSTPHELKGGRKTLFSTYKAKPSNLTWPNTVVRQHPVIAHQRSLIYLVFLAATLRLHRNAFLSSITSVSSYK